MRLGVLLPDHGCIRLSAVLGLVSLLFVMAAEAFHDPNANGVSDVWEARFGLVDPSPALDADGDGLSDRSEAMHGTDPHDATSLFQLAIEEPGADSPLVTWNSKTGKRYRVEGLDPEGEWRVLGDFVSGNGEMIGWADRVVGSGQTLAYRVAVMGFSSLGSRAEEVLRGLDTDSDGQSDWVEWQAGTSLIDPGEQLEIEQVSDQRTVCLSWPSVLGMAYRVQYFDGAQWADQPGVFTGDGEVQRLILPVLEDNRVFRVTMEALDSDDDGLCDWEERLAGLDPDHPNSAEAGRTDLEVLEEQLNQGGILSLEASRPVLNVTAGGSGAVRIRRMNGLAEVTVPLIVTGDGVAGVDYESLPPAVILPFGVQELEVPVELASSAAPAVRKELSVAIGPSPDFQLGEVTARTVAILAENLLNVRDFGALGDGVNDDTDAIQAAIDGLESSGQFNGLYFPAGTYRLATNSGSVSSARILDLGAEDLGGRDLIFRGEGGATLYSDIGSYRASTFRCFASFRSLSVLGLRFEQSPTPLWATPGYEPNRSDAFTFFHEDARFVEKIEFVDCEFFNCHRSVTFWGRGYDLRGHCSLAVFQNCRLLNPYGSNTASGETAWGGGQQVYMTAWIGEARYDNCEFDGGGEDMTDESTSPGGALKDGGHFGSPLRLKFTNNVVRRMGVEAVFQNDEQTLMGWTQSDFVVPPADNTTEVVVTVDSRPSTYEPGGVIVIRSPLTPGVDASSNTFFTIRGFDEVTREVRLSNLGYADSLPAGTTIPAGRVIYLDESWDSAVSIIEGNYVDGEIPPGGKAFAPQKGIVYSSRARVRGNFVRNCGRGIYSATSVHTPNHPPSTGSVIEENLIVTRNAQDYPEVYTLGIDALAGEERIRNNLIYCPVSWKTMGIRVGGNRAQLERNIVSASQIIRNGYASPVRAVGIGLGNTGSQMLGIANSTRGFDVGIGPAAAFQPRPYQAVEHESVLDVLAEDPVGSGKP